ncbi:MAG: hypothetical protein AAGM67_20180, partial [Bacteroidota bacterium]
MEGKKDYLRNTGSHVFLNHQVEQVLLEGNRALGVRLSDGVVVKAKRNVICNAPVWLLPNLLSESVSTSLGKESNITYSLSSLYACPFSTASFLSDLNKIEKTKSFLHLHVVINSTGIDVNTLKAHYTVMIKGLAPPVDVCGEGNMVAVSNPCILDSSLAPPG